MNKQLTVLFLIMLFFFCAKLNAQTSQSMKWFNPIYSDYPVLKGKYWQNTDSINFYNRLPTTAKGNIREGVWNLAKNTAGIYIDFFTNSSKIVVRYQIAEYRNFDTMNKVALNGLDMYAQDVSGTWHWINDSHNFNDTISFNYSNIDLNIKIKRFRLYLPLHTTLKWLEIGVDKAADFKAEPASEKNAMVFYGTSIMQGGAASRHGLTWLSVLGRRFDQQMINLGFSGSGTLDKSIIDLMNTVDAQLFALDCMPNLLPGNAAQATEIAQKITYAVETLRSKHPKVPILLVEHSGSLPGVKLDTTLTKGHQSASAVLSDTYLKLKSRVPYLYILTAKEIGFTLESTIDGVHPNDLGMMQYVNAYEKAIRQILRTKK